jgi:hypothetical protein
LIKLLLIKQQGQPSRLALFVFDAATQFALLDLHSRLASAAADGTHWFSMRRGRLL